MMECEQCLTARLIEWIEQKIFAAGQILRVIIVKHFESLFQDNCQRINNNEGT